MSDHTNSNIHRGDAASGKGLLIAFALIVAVVVILALVGSFAGGGDGTAGDSAITPAGEGIVAPALEQPAPVPTE
ncbi:hypothetical protein [uncultured Tateyamaria sp.]|uniref:hypothetical protein n=1 Tax=uncultured Tateyamaria sp. TaxID=455651 RepID=UPI00262CB398|nr:hypothetical protein [uncultured Tateyamaria sp.]